MSTIDFSADSAQPQKAMDKIEQQIEKFHKETGIKLEIKDGKPYYGGWLDLQGTAITSLPDNLVVGGWLYIECYRVITGSCAAGTKDYVENRLPKPYKEKYSIREIIELTKDEYQGEAFEEFFCK